MTRVVSLLLCLMITPGSAGAAPLIADLSRHLVAITTGFAGTEVLLFGAIDGPGDVVVLVRGPDTEVVMHRKSRVAGIWANTSSITFDQVPSFYRVASSSSIDEIASASVLARNQIGLDNLRIELPPAKASANVAKDWRDALVRNMQREGLYAASIGRVAFLGAQLFRTDIFFPPNVPTGTYQVQVFLLRDGQVMSAQTTPLIIGKIGLQAELYDFAHDYAAIYGIIAILVALVAGWLAHVAFRKP